MELNSLAMKRNETAMYTFIESPYLPHNHMNYRVNYQVRLPQQLQGRVSGAKNYRVEYQVSPLQKNCRVSCQIRPPHFTFVESTYLPHNRMNYRLSGKMIRTLR